VVGEDVDAFGSEVVGPRLAGGNAGRGTAERFADLEVADGRWSAAMVGFHAEHHRHGFIDG
jgi:hypothetical protein